MRLPTSAAPSPVRRLAIGALATLLLLPNLAAGQHLYFVAVDSDATTATGCTVATVDGPVDGVEQLLRISVIPGASPTVAELALAGCSGGSFGAFAPFAGGWPVGTDIGTSGADVVEAYLELASIPEGRTVVLTAFSLGEDGGQDAMSPVRVALQIPGIPTAGTWALLLMAGLLALAALRLLRRPALARSALAAGLLLLATGVAWAAVVMDGQIADWAGIPPAAVDVIGDATGGSQPADLVALYVEAITTRIAVRLDVVELENRPPVAADDAFTVDEGAVLAGDVLADNGSGPDTEPDGDGLVVTSTPVAAPAHGALVLNADGSFTYTHDGSETTSDTFTYEVCDDRTPALCTTAVVTITVNPVNDPPVVDPAAFSVAEDATLGTVVGTVTFTDPDPGQTHTFAITAGNTGGAFAIGSDTGAITVAAALDFETLAAYSLTVQVTDDGTPTLSGTAAVDVNVTDVDDPPVAVDDIATVTEDDPATAIDVLANDTDPDGGPIAVQSVTQPANGTVVITNAGADLTYQPDADYCNGGSPLDSFTYTLNGGSSATVSMTVTCIDDDPVAVDDAATVTEDDAATTVDVLANDTDVDGGPISIASVTQPANGTVVITNAGADLTYQPNADYCNDGSPLDTFTYTLTPGGSSATVSMTVTCVDDPPTAVDDAAAVAEDSGANALPVLANDTDVDAGPISVASVTQPANGTVAITGGASGVSYTPNANYCNAPPGTTPDVFTYTLTPGGSAATVTVTVTCVDDPPTAVPDAASVAEDSGASTINVLANDVDVDAGPISIIGVTQPANGTVAVTNGGADLSYTPTADYCNTPPGTTPDVFTYTLSPGGSTASVSVAVTCVNDGPVIDLDADDSQGTGGTDFAVTFTEGGGAVLLQDGLDATVTDVDSATVASLTVTISNLLDPGDEILSADVTGTSVIASYNAGTGTLTLVGPDTLANFEAVLRTVTYRNASNTPNTTARVVQFVANDGTSNGNTAVSTVTVTAVDNPPTAVADAFTVAEDSGATTLDVHTNDTDPDGGPSSVASVTQPANGSTVITGGGSGISYTPNADYCNDGSPVDTFTYTLDPGGSTATVSMTVTCVDDAPVAVADAATVAEDSGATAVDVLANDTDVDGGPISVASVVQPTNGVVVISGGGTGVTYTPNANYCNDGSPVDTFTYTLNGGSSTTVSVTVTCVDDDPVAVPDAATVVEDAAATAIDVLANDTDVDGGTNTVQSVTQPAGGVVLITGGGSGVTYTPNANYCNDGTPVDTFTYTLNGGSSTTVSVTVTCVDDPPTAVADAATVNEDSGTSLFSVQANDTDVDGGTNSITAVTQPLNGTVAITNGGADLSYTPNANYCNAAVAPSATPDTFTYTLTPGGSSAIVSVTVICVNDPPVAGADAFDFIGNTELRVDHGAATTPHVLEVTAGGTGLLENDADPVEGDPISIVGLTVGACVDASAPFDCSDPAVGRVQLDSDGSFSFQPAPGDTGATETFQYTLSDGTDTVNGTVTLTRFERVWYVKNDAAAGGDGTSAAPFNGITPANLSDNDGDGDLTDDLDAANDYIFIHFGDGTTTGQAGGLVLENGQHLIGEHAGLSIPVSLNGNGSPTVLVAAAPGSRPLLDDTVADAFDGVSARNVVPAEITGMNLAGNVNAVDWTTTAAFAGSGTFTIRDSVVRSAGGDGVDVNLAGTTTVLLAFHDNSVTATGTAVDIQETGDGSLMITAFDDNVVNGNTGGSGIVIGTAVFDAVPGGGLDTVNGGATAIGSLGNGVGGAGLALTNVQGDLHFTNLTVYADGGAGVSTTGTGAGFQLRVNTGGAATGVVRAVGGPAVNASATALDLRLTDLSSSNSTTTGARLNAVTGTFSAEAVSAITNATGTDFEIIGGTANVTYKGTITDDVGVLVAVSGATGGTKSFEGAITDGDDGDGSGVVLTGNGGATIRFAGGLVLSTGGNPAFTATGGGTIAVCDENPCNGGATGALVNKLTTTTGTALNVASTTIGAQNLEFRSISAGTVGSGPTNGIVVNNTGALGGLKVKGTGGAGSGGTIQNTAGVGISLTNTANVSLSNLQITNTGSHGISGIGMTDGSGGARPTFELLASRLTSPGDADGESGLYFGTSGSPANNSGRIVVTNTTVEQFEEFGMTVANSAGTLDLDLTGVTFDDNNDTHGETGLTVVGSGTAGLTLDLVGGSFLNLEGAGVSFVASGSGSNVANVSGVTFSGAGGPDDFPNNPYVTLASTDQNPLTFSIQGNTMLDAREGIVVVGDGIVNGRIGDVSGNTISGVAFDGIRLDMDGVFGSVLNPAAFDWRILISNNVLTGAATNTDDGIQILNRDHLGTLHLTIENNQIGTFSSEAVRYFAGERGTPVLGDTNGRLRIANNTFSNTGFGGAFDIVLRTTDAAVACFDITGNTETSGPWTIDFQETETSDQNVVQASLAAVAAANGGATVTSSGTSPDFSQGCGPELP